MRIEFSPPESVTEPRLWVRPEQVLAMVLRPGSIEVGVRRTGLTEFRYAAGEMILPHRHEGKWVGLMSAPHLELGISDAALMAASGGEVELSIYRKFADPACVRWLRPFMRSRLLGFRADGCFWILSNRRSPQRWSMVMQ